MSFLSHLIKLRPGEDPDIFNQKFNRLLEENDWEYVGPIEAEMPLGFEERRGYCTSVFHQNRDKPRRYILTKIWDVNKTQVTAIMTNPSNATEIKSDETVNFLLDYLEQPRFDFGGLTVVNTSPWVAGTVNSNSHFIEDNNNLSFIEQAIIHADLVILGWGGDGRKYGIPHIRENLRELLLQHQPKLRAFGFGREDKFPKHPHPRVPTQRFSLDSELQLVTQANIESIMSVGSEN
jgi:hypothetical protein